MKKCVMCTAPLSGQQQKYCSNACKQRAHYGKVKNNPKTMFAQTRRALERKRALVALKGGGCQQCGYDRNLAALEFHHVGPKSFPLDASHLSNSSMKRNLKEVEQCMLLCANCHREWHHPEATLE